MKYIKKALGMVLMASLALNLLVWNVFGAGLDFFLPCNVDADNQAQLEPVSFFGVEVIEGETVLTVKTSIVDDVSTERGWTYNVPSQEAEIYLSNEIYLYDGIIAEICVRTGEDGAYTNVVFNGTTNQVEIGDTQMASYEDNRWNKIEITRETATGKAIIYLNGTAIAHDIAMGNPGDHVTGYRNLFSADAEIIGDKILRPGCRNIRASSDLSYAPQVYTYGFDFENGAANDYGWGDSIALVKDPNNSDNQVMQVGDSSTAKGHMCLYPDVLFGDRVVAGFDFLIPEGKMPTAFSPRLHTGTDKGVEGEVNKASIRDYFKIGENGNLIIVLEGVETDTNVAFHYNIWYNITLVMNPILEGGKRTHASVYLDGVEVATTERAYCNGPKVREFGMRDVVGGTILMDNVLLSNDLAEIPKPNTFTLTGSSIAEGSVDVSVDTKTIELTFSQKLNPVSTDNFTMMAGSRESALADVVLGEDEKTVTLTFGEPLEADTIYTVTIEGITSQEGGKFSGENSIHFQTESLSVQTIRVSFDEDGITAKKFGWGDSIALVKDPTNGDNQVLSLGSAEKADTMCIYPQNFLDGYFGKRVIAGYDMLIPAGNRPTAFRPYLNTGDDVDVNKSSLNNYYKFDPQGNLVVVLEGVETNTNIKIEENVWYNITAVIDPIPEKAGRTKASVYVDGNLVATTSKAYCNGPKARDFALRDVKGGSILVDNVVLSNDPNEIPQPKALTLVSCSIADGSKNVSVSTKTMDLLFSEPINAVSKDNFVLSADSGTADYESVSLAQDGKSVTLTFAGNLQYDMEYTLTVSGVTAQKSGSALEGKNTVVFTTESDSTGAYITHRYPFDDGKTDGGLDGWDFREVKDDPKDPTNKVLQVGNGLGTKGTMAFYPPVYFGERAIVGYDLLIPSDSKPSSFRPYINTGDTAEVNKQTLNYYYKIGENGNLISSLDGNDKDTGIQFKYDEWYNITVVLDPIPAQAGRTAAYLYINNTLVDQVSNAYCNGPILRDIALRDVTDGKIFLDNIVVSNDPAEIPQPLALTGSSIADGAENVDVLTTQLTYAFNNRLADVTKDNFLLTQTRGDVTTPVGYESVSLSSDRKTVTVKLSSTLRGFAQYTMTMENVTAYVGGGQLNGRNTVSFATQEGERYYGDVTFESGADGKLYASVVCENDRMSAGDASIILGTYSDVNGHPIFDEIVTVTQNIAAGGSATLRAGIQVPEGKKVKVFFWDTMKAMQPLAESVEYVK